MEDKATSVLTVSEWRAVQPVYIRHEIRDRAARHGSVTVDRRMVEKACGLPEYAPWATTLEKVHALAVSLGLRVLAGEDVGDGEHFEFSRAASPSAAAGIVGGAGPRKAG